MVIGSMASPFCIPLSLGIHQGLVHEKRMISKKKVHGGHQGQKIEEIL